jgi:biopolymer transport protein ExbD
MKIKRQPSRAEVPSIAMGDIAFNLLVFFVILARAQDDSHLQWKAAKAKDLEVAKYTKVSIVIDKDEKLYVNGLQVNESQLGPMITKYLGEAPPGERTVLLKADKDSKALRFQPVLEAIGEAGGDLVHVLDDDRKK